MDSLPADTVSTSRPDAADGAIPLVVDLDGTLLRSDMLVETFFALLAVAPLRALGAVAALRQGRAAFKARVAGDAGLDLAALPWNEQVIDLIEAARAEGRPVYLASASDRRLVAAVAAHLGLFDGIFASDGRTNLSSHAKAAVLCDAFGAGGFDYVGNSGADVAVFERARAVIVVSTTQRFADRMLARWPDARVIHSGSATPKTYARAIRVHQWLKNLLLFVPMLGAHHFTLAAISSCVLGFFSFSLCASSVYVMNDLVDLGRDRLHPTKRRRPFAAGTVPVLHGLVMVPLLLGAAVVLALLVSSSFSVKFMAVLGVYYVITVAYSLWLKRLMMIDIVVLACLYGLRLLAGGAAASVPLSAWLALFALFLFTMLATVKRCTELAERVAAGKGNPAGRDYQLGDLPLLEGFAAASGLTAILVLALYANSDAVAALYVHPKWLAGLCVVTVYWVGRVLLLMHRGQMKDDPVVFAATDRISLGCGAIAGAVVAAASI